MKLDHLEKSSLVTLLGIFLTVAVGHVHEYLRLDPRALGNIASLVAGLGSENLALSLLTFPLVSITFWVTIFGLMTAFFGLGLVYNCRMSTHK